MALAELVLAGHLAVIAFNLFGLFAIPLGGGLGWTFVRAPLWRALHVASLGVVALQALAGQACFLTIWQAELTGARDHQPMIMQWVNGLIFWPLPFWAFTAAYVAIFAYVIALLWIVPPRRWRQQRNPGRGTGESP